MKKFLNFLGSNSFFYALYYIMTCMELARCAFGKLEITNNLLFNYIFITAIFIVSKIEDLQFKNKQ